MPGANSSSAPKFKATPLGISRYFDELEDCFEAANVVEDKDKIRYAKRYVEADEVAAWSAVEEGTPPSYRTFVDNVKKLYPGSEGESRYTIGDLEAVALASRNARTMTRAEEAEYYRKFMPIAVFLEKAGKVSKYQVGKAYLSGFTDGVAGRIQYRAELQNPTIDPADGFDLTKLHDAAKMALDAVGFGGGGSSGGRASNQPQSGGVIKVEAPDVSELARTIAAALAQVQVQQGPAARAQGGGGYYQPGGFGQSYGGYQGQYQGGRAGGNMSGGNRCNFCDLPDHFVRNCPDVQKYLALGKVVISADNRIMLPNGQYIPRSLPGNCMKDRVDHWITLNPLSVPQAGGNTSGTDGGPQRDRPPHLQSHLLEAVVTYSAATEEPRTNEDGGGEDDDDLARLEANLAALSTEAARLRSKKVRFADDSKSGGKDSGGASKATVRGPGGGKPPGVPAKAAGDTVAQQGKTGQGPQYKYTSKLTGDGDSMKKADELVGRMLDGHAGVTWSELGEVSLEFRKAMNERSKVHRVPLGSNLIESGGEATILAAIHKQQPKASYGCWDNLTLRAVRPTINGYGGIECVLDSGSQMVVVRKDVWEKIGGTLLPDEGIMMETANRATVRTVGKTNGLVFDFNGEVEVRLNAQIVEEAPFDVLLGRPFFAATSCVTKDHEDGKMEITLTDPESKKKVQVRTYERVPQPVDSADVEEGF